MRKITKKQKVLLNELVLNQKGEVRDVAQPLLQPKVKYRIYRQSGSGRSSRIIEDKYINNIIKICEVLKINYTQSNDAPRGGKLGAYITVNIKKEIDLLKLLDYKAPEQDLERFKVKYQGVQNVVVNGWYSIGEILEAVRVSFSPLQKQELSEYLKGITKAKKRKLDGETYSYNVYDMTDHLVNAKAFNYIKREVSK